MKSFDIIFEKAKNALIKGLNLKVARPKTDIDPDHLYDDGLTNYDSFSQSISQWLRRNAEDKEKYEDYQLMDNEIPEISAGLDIIADFVIYPDCVNKTKIFEIKSKKKDKQISEKIKMIDDITGFRKEFWSIVRETCKYGDDPEELLKNKNGEIVSMKNIPVETFCVNTVNGIISQETPYKQVNIRGETIASLKQDEALHFCLASDRRRYSIYGKGVSKLEKGRLIYRQLRLMEEGMMVSRLSSANQNYAIIMDVGDYDPIESIEYMDKYRKRLNRKKYIDPQTGHISFKWNPLSMVEDLIIPTRAGSNASVVQLNKPANQNIDDVNYFQNKLIYSMNVPKLLIGKEDDVNSKATSEVQYISFLRMIRRIQKLLENEIIHFYTVALASFGIKDAELYIEWPLAGTIDEERKWKIEQLKVSIAASLSQDMQMVDDYWIYTNLMGMSDDEVNTLVKRMDDAEQKSLQEIEDDAEGAEGFSDTPPGEDPLAPKTTGSKAPKGKQGNARPVSPKSKSSKSSEEEIAKYFTEKIGEKKASKVMEFRKTMEADPELRKSFVELVAITKIQSGDLS